MGRRVPRARREEHGARTPRHSWIRHAARLTGRSVTGASGARGWRPCRAGYFRCGLDGPNQVPVVQPHGRWILFHSWSGRATPAAIPGASRVAAAPGAARPPGSSSARLSAGWCPRCVRPASGRECLRARGPLRHLPRRHPVPGHGQGGGGAAGAPRPRGGLPRGADLLRADARQHAAMQLEAVPLVRRFVRAFADAEVVVSPSASCVGMVRDQYAGIAALAGDPGWRARCGARAARGGAERVPGGPPGRGGRGAYYPHRVTYHPTCHSLRLLQVGDRPLRLLRAVRGHRPGGAAGRGRVLRLRRHLRGQERGHLGGDAHRQAAARARHARRGVRGRGQLVPDAHRRRAAAPARRSARRCTSPRCWRRRE